MHSAMHEIIVMNFFTRRETDDSVPQVNHFKEFIVCIKQFYLTHRFCRPHTEGFLET